MAALSWLRPGVWVTRPRGTVVLLLRSVTFTCTPPWERESIISDVGNKKTFMDPVFTGRNGCEEHWCYITTAGILEVTCWQRRCRGGGWGDPWPFRLHPSSRLSQQFLCRSLDGDMLFWKRSNSSSSSSILRTTLGLCVGEIRLAAVR